MRVARRTTVAHYVSLYLPRTQTFIYQVLTHHRRYRPVVLASQRVEPRALAQFQFAFEFPTLDAALKDIVSGMSVTNSPAQTT